ncbi:MAG: hypothetical protein KDK45_22845, partial [Leptospiraceae bacterium]|nr:hypothetical protein [Leptospiraceae bacterium]
MKGKDLDINTGLQENFEGNAKTRKIFLLPFDLKAKDLKNTFITPSIIRKARKKSEEENQLPPQIESKRNRIFNPELKSLIG